MQKLSISIGIPMYNHERTIRATLNSIVSQLDEIKDICDLEVVISDNCSTDASPQIIKDEYITKYPDVIKYFRNDENIGASFNVGKPFEYATKDYVWLFGDDLFLPGSIKFLCDNVGSDEYSVIRVNHDRQEELECNDIATTNNVYDYLNIVKHNFFVLSTNIIKREYYLSCKSIDYNTYHPHADAIIKILKTNKNALIINKSLIHYLEDSRIYNADSELIYGIGSSNVIVNNGLDLSKIDNDIYLNEYCNVFCRIQRMDFIDYRRIFPYIKDAKILKHRWIINLEQLFGIKLTLILLTLQPHSILILILKKLKLYNLLRLCKKTLKST